MDNRDAYPPTRAEAKQLGAKFYFTGEPCKRGHVALRKTKGVCVSCAEEDWRASTSKRAEYFSTYRASARGKEVQQAYYARNTEKVKDRAKARSAEERRIYRANWKARNTDAVRSMTNARKRRNRDASPPWLTKEHKAAIATMYTLAVQLTKSTGVKHVVDHICPLQGENSCGLHVPWNLQVITHIENSKKHNRVPEGAGLAFPDGSGYIEHSKGAA